jgi:hypothetical protein
MHEGVSRNTDHLYIVPNKGNALTLRRQAAVTGSISARRKFIFSQFQISRRVTVPRFFYTIGIAVFRKVVPGATASPHRTIGTPETARSAAAISDGAFVDLALHPLRAKDSEEARRSMNGGAARRASLFLGVTLLLGACGQHLGLGTDSSGGDADALNAYPTNYKSNILAAMHAYLNDPTGIHDAAIAEPALKSSGNLTRYVVCLKFNPKKNAGEYAGVKEIAAAFLLGRFDQFIETAHDLCAGAVYTPFPELQKLSP